MPPVIKIADQFLDAMAQAKALGEEQLFTRANRKLLEWLVLGAVCELLEKNGLSHPSYAIESEAPDFLAYAADQQTMWAEIEITETLRPGRQRNREMSAASPHFIVPIPPPLKDPFKALRDILRTKSQKPYAKRCVLFVYFNLGEWDLAYENDAVVEMIQNEAEARPFEDVAHFRRVLLLDASMQHLVELTRV